MGACLGGVEDVGDKRVFIKRRLGEGAFSDVHLATDAATGERYALKVVPCVDRRDFDAAEREARMYGRFNHKNLVRCVAWSATPREVRMLFPLFVSGTALDLLTASPRGLATADALAIFAGACAGLAAMHGSNPPVAHRDIKPANILMDGATPVLTDFGSATEAAVSVANRKEALSLQEHAAVHSTLPFRAPELFEVQVGWAENNSLQAADVWALGCTLYSLLFGESPFERAAGPHGSLTLAIAQGRFDVPDGHPHPPAVVELVHGALVLDARLRRTVDQVRRARLSKLHAAIKVFGPDRNACFLAS